MPAGYKCHLHSQTVELVVARVNFTLTQDKQCSRPIESGKLDACGRESHQCAEIISFQIWHSKCQHAFKLIAEPLTVMTIGKLPEDEHPLIGRIQDDHVLFAALLVRLTLSASK